MMGLLKGLLVSPARDAKKIMEALDYRLLRVAWEEFVRFRGHHDANDRLRLAPPVWLALQMVVNNGGFEGFGPQEMKFLQTLKKAPEIFGEAVEVLVKAPYTDEDAARLFDSHHDLPQVITPEFQEYRRKEVMRILIEVAKSAQVELETFVRRHEAEIDKEIAVLQAKVDAGQG